MIDKKINLKFEKNPVKEKFKLSTLMSLLIKDEKHIE